LNVFKQLIPLGNGPALPNNRCQFPETNNIVWDLIEPVRGPGTQYLVKYKNGGQNDAQIRIDLVTDGLVCFTYTLHAELTNNDMMKTATMIWPYFAPDKPDMYIFLYDGPNHKYTVYKVVIGAGANTIVKTAWESETHIDNKETILMPFLY